MAMDVQDGCPWCERPWQGPADAAAQRRCEKATKQNEDTFDRDVEKKVKERLVEMRGELRANVREELEERYEPLKRKLEDAEKALAKRYKKDEVACDTAFDEGKAKARRELAADLNQKTRDINLLRKQLGELQRKLERKSAGELGEGAEFDLCEALRGACVEDHVRRTGKGEAGADAVQEVRDGGVVCGMILWERKNYASPVTVKPEWIVTARENLARHGAAYIVLVPNALPKRMAVRHDRDGVFVVLPDAVAVFACVLRKLLIEAHRAGSRARAWGGHCRATLRPARSSASSARPSPSSAPSGRPSTERSPPRSGGGKSARDGQTGRMVRSQRL